MKPLTGLWKNLTETESPVSENENTNESPDYDPDNTGEARRIFRRF